MPVKEEYELLNNRDEVYGRFEIMDDFTADPLIIRIGCMAVYCEYGHFAVHITRPDLLGKQITLDDFGALSQCCNICEKAKAAYAAYNYKYDELELNIGCPSCDTSPLRVSYLEAENDKK